MPDTLTFDPKQISDVLKRSVSQYKSEISVQEVGEVIDCGDGITASNLVWSFRFHP